MPGDKDKETKNVGWLDLNLWKAMTKDVDPLNKDNPYIDVEGPEQNHIKTPKKQKPKQTDHAQRQNEKLLSAEPRSKEIDKNTLKKLQKGQVPIEATLDLHGYSQDHARVELERFILAAYASGKRCLLVITGHGKRQKQNEDLEFWGRQPAGILKKRLPDWLTEGTLNDIVLKGIPAHRKDGGEGAFYIYLRKKSKLTPRQA